MPMDFGLSFAPTDNRDRPASDRPGGTPIQDAIRVLSLQIPKVVGAQGLAPGPLLHGMGSAGMPGGMGMPGGLEQWLRQMFGQLLPMGMGGMPMGMGGMPMGGGPTSLPAPNIGPGALPGGPPQMPAGPSGPMPGRSQPPSLGNPPIEVPPYGRGNPFGGGTEWWGGKPSLPESPVVSGMGRRGR